MNKKWWIWIAAAIASAAVFSTLILVSAFGGGLPGGRLEVFSYDCEKDGLAYHYFLSYVGGDNVALSLDVLDNGQVIVDEFTSGLAESDMEDFSRILDRYNGKTWDKTNGVSAYNAGYTERISIRYGENTYHHIYGIPAQYAAARGELEAKLDELTETWFPDLQIDQAHAPAPTVAPVPAPGIEIHAEDIARFYYTYNGVFTTFWLDDGTAVCGKVYDGYDEVKIGKEFSLAEFEGLAGRIAGAAGDDGEVRITIQNPDENSQEVRVSEDVILEIEQSMNGGDPWFHLSDGSEIKLSGSLMIMAIRGNVMDGVSVSAPNHPDGVTQADLSGPGHESVFELSYSHADDYSQVKTAADYDYEEWYLDDADVALISAWLEYCGAEDWASDFSVDAVEDPDSIGAEEIGDSAAAFAEGYGLAMIAYLDGDSVNGMYLGKDIPQSMLEFIDMMTAVYGIAA